MTSKTVENSVRLALLGVSLDKRKSLTKYIESAIETHPEYNGVLSVIDSPESKISEFINPLTVAMLLSDSFSKSGVVKKKRFFSSDKHIPSSALEKIDCSIDSFYQSLIKTKKQNDSFRDSKSFIERLESKASLKTNIHYVDFT